MYGSNTLLASFPGHSQILSRSRGKKSVEGLVPLLRHEPEMVDLVRKAFSLNFCVLRSCKKSETSQQVRVSLAWK